MGTSLSHQFTQAGRDRSASFDNLSEFIGFLDAYPGEPNCVIVHADLLADRYEVKSGIGSIVSHPDFMSADVFLYFATTTRSGAAWGSSSWRPWSALYLKETPPFLMEARQHATAASLNVVFNQTDSSKTRTLLLDGNNQLRKLWKDRLSFWHTPIDARIIQEFDTVT
jgi:hypothetical protein